VKQEPQPTPPVQTVRLTKEALEKHAQGSKVRRYFGCQSCVFHFWKTVSQTRIDV
jgi:hypothetical protein